MNKNPQKCTLFDHVFYTPLRELFEVENSYFVCRISYVAKGNSATDFTDYIEKYSHGERRGFLDPRRRNSRAGEITGLLQIFLGTKASFKIKK